MKFSYIVILIFYLSYCTGKTEKNSIERRIFSEKIIPKETLRVYVDLLHLDRINDGVDSFEIRKWGPFINDSFPVFMERYFYEKSKFQGEVYFFYKKNGNPILGIGDLRNIEDIKFEKYTLGELPGRYLDSLVTSYNLFKIDSFDVGLIKRMTEKGYLTHTVSMLLIEQSSRSNYICTFTHYPQSFFHFNQNYAFLSAFHQFTESSLLLRNDSIKRWINDRNLKVVQYLTTLP